MKHMFSAMKLEPELSVKNVQILFNFKCNGRALSSTPTLSAGKIQAVNYFLSPRIRSNPNSKPENCFFVSWCLLSRIKELQLCDLKCRKISKSGLLLNFPQSIAINCTESENQSIYCKCTFCTSFLFQRAKIHHDLKQKKFPPCNQCPCNYFTISKPYHLHRLCLQQQQR